MSSESRNSPDQPSIKDLPPIPKGIQALVDRAARDEAFRSCLLEEREHAIAEAGSVLNPREQHVLRAIPRSQLETIIDRIRLHIAERHRFLLAAAGMVGLGVLGSAAGCKDPPTEERPSVRAVAEEGGISPRESRGAPACKLNAEVDPFVTMSGPDRDLGEANRSGLKSRLKNACGRLSISKPGELTYELTIAPSGSIESIKTVSNTTGSEDLDKIMRQYVERLNVFGANDPTKVSVKMTLR